VFRRDKGICAVCAGDAAMAERILKRFRAADDVESGQLLLRLWKASRKTIYEALPALWEADHRIPVVSGGSGCGLDGFVTLCRPCHIAKTNIDRGWDRTKLVLQ
jgi:5-methylcytosine-specific restriction endonuclease McrA